MTAAKPVKRAPRAPRAPRRQLTFVRPQLLLHEARALEAFLQRSLDDALEAGYLVDPDIGAVLAEVRRVASPVS